MHRLVPFALAVTTTLSASIALADYVPPSNGDDEPEVGEEPAPKPGKRKFYVVEVEEVERPTRHVTVSFEPLHLFYPIVQIGAEVRATDEISIVVFGGSGKAPVLGSDVIYTGPDKVNVWEVGGEFRYYATGDFSYGGMHVGAEALFMHASIDGPAILAGGAVGGLAAGFTVGPNLGWKFVTRGGFTVDSSIGIGFRAAKQSTDPNAPKDDNSAVLLGSLAIGWTF
jgi:hypothetical protein